MHVYNCIAEFTNQIKQIFFIKFNFPHPLFILWLTVTFLHYMAKMLQDLQINNSSFSY